MTQWMSCGKRTKRCPSVNTVETHAADAVFGLLITWVAFNHMVYILRYSHFIIAQKRGRLKAQNTFRLSELGVVDNFIFACGIQPSE